MRSALEISEIRLHLASPRHRRQGLIGWVSLIVNGKLGISGIAIRRTRNGRVALAFPARTDRTGQQWPYVRPLDDATRREIETGVFEALDLNQVLTS